MINFLLVMLKVRIKVKRYMEDGVQTVHPGTLLRRYVVEGHLLKGAGLAGWQYHAWSSLFLDPTGPQRRKEEE